MSESYKKYSQLHIQLLEPRIMFDGAAVYTASEALDLLDDQQSSQAQSDPSQIISDVTSITENQNAQKEIVFIDSGVDNYQTIVNAIDSSKSIYLIDSNENGFLKMQSILQSQQDIDAVHIIGHASAGQVVLGNSVLNADNINSFSSTLQSIGNALTQNGDLLFYGCNLAQGEQGKLLLQQIGNITQADIAASDDITGKGGDWKLEHNYGIVETNGIEVVDYNSSLLQQGISSVVGFVENTGTDLRAGRNAANHASSASNHSDGYKPFVIAYERTVTSGSYTFYNNSNTSSGFEENNSGVQTAGPNISSNTTTVDASSTPMNVYYVYASENSGRNTTRSVTFEGEIKGVWFNMNNIVSYSGVSKSGATYHTESQHGSNSRNAYSTEKLKWNWGTNLTINSKPNHKNDWFGVDTDSNTLYVGFNNGADHGDIIRVFTADTTNQAPTARDDDGVVNENATLTVTNGANKNETGGSYDTNGEHSGDVIDTTNTASEDTDPDGDTLSVDAVRLGSTEGSGTSGTVGSALTGTYGQLTLNSNGSYTYVANQAAADLLDAGDVAYDYFNYTVTDTSLTDTALLTIRINGVNDDVTAVNDYGVVTENATLTVTDGESQNLSGSYDTHDEHSGDVGANEQDADASAVHTITAIRTGSTEGSGTSGSLGSALTGTYGQLTLNANGSYTYEANQAAAEALDDGESAWDYFNYTVSDGTDTDTGRIDIKVLGINDAPVGRNDEGVIAEGSTLTVANSANANETNDSGTTYNATGEHTGDVLDTSLATSEDTDVDTNDTLTVSAIRTGRESAAAATFVDSKSVQSGITGGIAFNTDGTKMFVANVTNDDVDEYTLSTGFDVSTASYDSNFSVASQDGGPNGIAFNTDGTKMFIAGKQTDSVYEYTLSTGFDVSTASYDSSFSIASQEESVTDLAFNTDGTKMFTVGTDNRSVYEYNLSTGFDVSTASYVDGFSVASQETVPTGLEFSADGKRMFITGNNGDDITEYKLTTAFDVSTSSHVGQFDVSSQETQASSIAFNAEGTKMFVLGYNGEDVNEYNLTSAFRVANDTGSVGSTLVGAYGTLTLNSNGSYTYVANNSIVGLDASESVYDYFTYTVTDGTDTDTAELKITVLGASNTAPVARDDVGVILEDGTLNVADGANANESGGTYDATGEHSGDVLHTSSTTHYDTDADGDTLTVTQIKPSGGSNSAVNNNTTYNGSGSSAGTTVTGTYGQLTIGSDGSYTYEANQAAADLLDAGDEVDDVFVYTVSDGTTADDQTANITIKVIGINDVPVAQDDVGVIVEGSTLTVANSANANESGGTYDATGEHSGDVIDTSSSSHTDSDADASASLSVSQIKLSGGSNSAVSSGTTNSNGTSVTGTYGTLTIGADGSYTYAATTAAADALDTGEEGVDTFVYTLKDDQNAIATANLTITVLGANDAPVARDDSGTVNEDQTLTVSNSDGTSTVSSLSFVQSATITTQESYPRDVAFNNDGTKMFVVGANGDAVDEWTLSTAYDISTLSHVGNYSVSTNGSELLPWGLSFNNDGTKMFVSGDSTNKILEYHLSTPFTISTASYDSGFDLSSQDATPIGHAFNNDGTKLFVTGHTNDAVFEYTLSTGFDVSTASYVDSFSVASQETYPRNLEFNSDGTKMFIVGADTDAILEYDLSTGFDVSTASYKGNASVNTNASNPNGITFNHDGTKVFITNGSGTGTVIEYNLTSPFNVVDVNGEHTGDVIDSSNTSTQDTDVDVETLTVSAVRKGSSEGSGTAGTVGQALTGTYGDLTLNADGSYTYVANHADADALDAGDVVTDTFNYTVTDGTANDTAVITITIIGVNDTPTAQNDFGAIVEDGTLTVTNGANASNDGSINTTGEHSGDLMDTSSASHKDSDVDASDSISITQIKKSGGSNSAVSSGSSYNSSGTQVVGTYGTLTIGADGSYTYVANQDAADALDEGETDNDVFTYTLFDGTATTTANLTITVIGANEAPDAQDDSGTVIEDGTLTVSDGDNTSTIVGASFVDSFDLSSQESSPQGVAFNTDGTKMFIVGWGGDEVNEYTLSTGFDVSTASYDSNFSVASQESIAQDIAFNNDGTKMFIVGSGGDEVNEYHLSTGFDVSTASYDSNFSVASQEDSPQGIAFNNDGTKMFITGGAGDDVNEYTLSTGFDVSTASFVDSFSISSQDTLPNGLAFSNDGKKMFVTGNNDDDINEYTLSTGFDVSTASFVGSISVTSQDTVPGGIKFNHDGTKLFMVGVNGADINEYTLTTPFSLIDVSGEHTGDVLDTSNTSTRDTDVDVETLLVTAVRTGSSEGSGTDGTVGSALTGTYGQLTLNSNGSYTYVANQSAADDLDAGDVVTDSFNYTVSDGTSGTVATDTAVITITVIGINDAPTAQDDVGFIVEDGTLTVTNGANATLDGSYDATGENSGDLMDTTSASHKDSDVDDHDTLSITQIKKSGGSNSSVAIGSSYNSSGTQVVGTYGTLTIGADGSYTYIANQDAADVLDVGQSANDVFTYTLTDGVTSTTANLTITVLGANDAPVAQDDSGTINEDATLTVANGDDSNTISGASFVKTKVFPSTEIRMSTGHTFNNDGTKLYVLDFLDKDISEYTLSTAFDVSTASYVDNFNFSAQDSQGQVYDLVFNTDGTKMFIVSNGSDSIIEYHLSTAFDVSTASYDSSLSTFGSGVTIDSAPVALAFNTDGTKMFMVGAANAKVNEYTLSTGFDISTASYVDGFSISSDFAVYGLVFNTDGTKMFLMDAYDDDIHEYTLSTGFDVSTASVSGSFVQTKDTSPVGLSFNPDGTKMFITGTGSNSIHEFALTTPFSLVNISGEHTGDVIDTSSTSNKDSDVDGDTLTVTQIKKSGGSNSAVSSGTTNTNGTSVTGTYGVLTIGADGSYKYIANQTAADALDAGDQVTDVFTYTLSDGALTDTANITITVIGINDAPTAQNDVGVINEDAEFSVLDGANKNETGGSFNASGEHSGDVINTTSASHVDSDADASASLTITSIKKDGGSESAVAVGSSYNSNGTQVTGAYGTLTIGANGSYNYSANLDAADGISAGQQATDTFVYTLSDGTQTTTATLTITILGVNDNPTAQNDVGVIREGSTLTVENSDNANVSGSFDVTGEHSGDLINTTSSSHKDSDPDTNDTLTITKIQHSGAGSATNVANQTYSHGSATSVSGSYGTLTIGSDGSYKYVANDNITGLDSSSDSVTDTFTYTLFDGTATTTATVTITVVGGDGNRPPVATNNTNSVNEDATVTASDGSSGATGDVVSNDSDPDGDTMTVTAIQPGSGSTSSVSSGTTNSNGTSVTGTYGTLTIGADGSYTYVADQSAADDLDLNDNATDVFTYTVSDGNGGQDTATITITLTGVNDDPVAVNDTNSVSEDGTITVTGAAPNDVLVNDSDPDDSATISVSAIQPSGGSSSSVSGSTTYSNGTTVTGTYGTLTIGADGSYTYTADQAAADALDVGDNADDVFTYTTTDENGATTTATLTITVTGSNDTPVAQDDVGVISEDGTLTVTNGSNGNSDGTINTTGEHSGDVIDTTSSSHKDSDPDASPTLEITQIKKDGGSDSAVSSGSSYNSSGTSVTGTYGTLTIGADGSYTYVADQAAADALDDGDSVDDVFVYTLSDEHNATTTANITITVKGINDTPTAVADTDSISEGGTITVGASDNENVLIDDSDLDDSATLTVSAIQPSGGSSSSVTSGTTSSNGTSVTGTYGTLTIGADGSYTYVANTAAANALDSGEAEDDIFTYTVTDENGATATATITITVNGQNDAPVAQDDVGWVAEDSTLIVTNGSNASVNGSYDIAGENSGDVIDTTSTSHQDSDVDGDTLTITQIKKDGGSNSAVTSGSSYNSNGTSIVGTYGTLTIGADGSYKYVADQDAADVLDQGDQANDVFVYTLFDGTDTTTANITITVTGLNDDLTAVNDSNEVNAEQTVTKATSGVGILENDSDVDGDDSPTVVRVMYSGTNVYPPAGSTYDSNGVSLTGTFGTLTIGADGSYTYTADQAAALSLSAGQYGIDTFPYYIQDGNTPTPGEGNALLSIKVWGSNDPPVARDDSGTVKEDATLTVSDGDNANAESAATFVDGLSFSSQEINPQGFRFNNDGTKMYLIGHKGDDVNEYNLSTAFDISTASYSQNFDFSAQEQGPRDLAFNDDGTKMFIVGLRGDKVYEYTLSTAFDVSTASHASSDFDISGQDDTATAIAFNNNGTKMFITGNDGNDINEYTLSTAFDVSTATYDSNFSVNSEDREPNGLTFNSDGTKMFVAGNQNNNIYEYNLSLGFDVSTASYVGALDVSSQDSTPKAVNFNNDGTKLFVLGANNLQVFEYTLTTPFSLINVTGEHSGDVINTSNTSSYDTDSDGDTLTVSTVRIGNSEGSGTEVNAGNTLTGTYGQLTLNANGSYTYVANQTAADDLDAGDVVYDYFNYTVSDGNGGTDIAVITITVVGINDTPAAVNDTGAVNEDETLEVPGGGDDVLNDDTDADDSHALTVTAITPSGGSTSTVSEGSTFSSGGTTVTGTYGTLTIGADGSYTYTADQAAADALDAGSPSDTVTDVFTYTVSDGTNSTTATLTITVTGVNDPVIAVNDYAIVNEDGNVNVGNDNAATVSGTTTPLWPDSYDVHQEHSGDASLNDTDLDASSTLTINAIRLGNTEGSGTAGTVGSALTGTYGQLTLLANGTYYYIANQAAADALDVGDVVYDYFNYTVTDGSTSDIGTISIKIVGINDTPTAVDDANTVGEDQRITILASGDDALNDDTDADADASLKITNISHTNGNTESVTDNTGHANGTTIVGTYGTLTIGSDGSYTYIADQAAADALDNGESANDVFTYTISDGEGGTDTATITITINGSDNEVVANDDTDAVDASSTVTVNAPSSGLLSNDTDNGNPLLSEGEGSVTAIRTGRENRTGTDGTLGSEIVGTYGTLTVNADGTYTYTANTDAAKALEPLETAIDYFTYTISDGTSTDTAELRITVTGINDPPTSTAPPIIRATEKQTIKIQTKIFFDDPDPNNTIYGQLSYSSSGLPAGLTINDQGRIKGRLPEGTYTFTITATDGGNLSTQQTFTIIVGKPPIGEPDPQVPVKINKKTIEEAEAKGILTFREEAPDRLPIEDLQVRSTLASLIKDYTFNGGMKVIDVAVEDLNLKENNFNSFDGGNIGIQEDTILGFAIGDDYRLNVKQYTGTLEDGSALPNWVKVDPSTGQTIVQFPDDIFTINVKVIAIDKDNTTREINVTLDKNSVRRDTALKRDLEPFIDRSAALKTEIEIDDRGQIILQSSDESEQDQIRNDVLNFNDTTNDNNQTSDPNSQSNLDNVPVIPEFIEESPAQENLALDSQSLDLEEKVVNFASLQDQIDLEFEGYENYGDKLTKANS